MTESRAAQDRRRAERVKAQAFARLSPTRADGDHNLGVIVDVSTGGVGVHTPARYYVGECLTLRAAAGDRLHDLACEVRRVTPAEHGLWEVGLRFTGAAADRDFLAAMLPVTLLPA